MAGKTQEALVTAQFGPQAKAYVTSAVHAGGADLDQIETLVRGHAMPGARSRLRRRPCELPGGTPCPRGGGL
jgi:hypothetical protein